VAAFEDLGRKLDRELERLRDLAEKKISPKTRVKTAQTLRTVAQKLSKMAEELESQSEPKEM